MKVLLSYFHFGNGTWFRAMGRSRKETEAIFTRYYSRSEVKNRGGAKRSERWIDVGSALIGDYSGGDKKTWTIGRY